MFNEEVNEMIDMFIPNYFQQLISIEIENHIWFVADDVTTLLDLKDSSQILDILDEKECLTTEIDRNGKVSRVNLISESGLYVLIFQSTTESAKKYRKWVTYHILPYLRIHDYYSIKRSEIPNFEIRFNVNWDRIEHGYFSILSELFIRLYGCFEHVGYILPVKASYGKEMRPDLSVTIYFDKYLEKYYPQHKQDFKMYMHRLPNGKQIEVKQYKNALLPIFVEYIDLHWLPEHAQKYFEERDKKALAYLPKLIS